MEFKPPLLIAPKEPEPRLEPKETEPMCGLTDLLELEELLLELPLELEEPLLELEELLLELEGPGPLLAAKEPKTPLEPRDSLEPLMEVRGFFGLKEANSLLKEPSTLFVLLKEPNALLVFFVMLPLITLLTLAGPRPLIEKEPTLFPFEITDFLFAPLSLAAEILG